jgi:hypothetical protein
MLRAQLGSAVITALERISHLKKASPVSGTVVIYTHATGMRIIFGMAVSLLLETDAQSD